MFFLVTILLVLLPFVQGFINRVTTYRFSLLSITFLFLSPFVIFLVLLVPFKSFDYIFFQVICMLILSFQIVFVLVLLIYKYIKLKKTIDLKSFITPSIITIFLLTIYIVSFFLSTSSSDVIYYSSISQNFIFSIYSADNIHGFVTENQYLVTPLYYFIAVFFPNNIYQSYIILNLLLFSLLLIGVFDKIKDLYKIKYGNLFMLLSVIALVFPAINFSVSISTGWFISLLILPILIVHYKETNLFFVTVMFTAMLFFSSSSLILGIPASIAYMAYSMVKNESKSWIPYLWMPCALFLLALFSSAISSIKFEWVLLILFLVIIVNFVFFLLMKKYYFSHSFEQKNKKWTNNKIYFWSAILISVITIVLICFLYGYKLYVDNFLILALFSIPLLVIFFGLFLFFKFKFENDEYSDFFLLLILVNFCAVALYILLDILKIDLSVFWRILSLINIGAEPNVLQIVVSYFVLVTIVFNISFENTLASNNKCFFKIKQNKDKINIALMLVAAASLPNVTSNINYFINYKKDIYTPYAQDKLSYADINFLKKLPSGNYLSDTYVGEFVKGINVNSFINYNSEDKLNMRSQSWMAGGFLYGIENWNKTYPQKPIIIGSQDQALVVSDIITKTLNDFASYKVMSYNNQTIDIVDYVIISPVFSYFEKLQTSLSIDDFENIYQGNGIFIFENKKVLNKW